MDQFLKLVSWKSGFPRADSLSLFLSLPPSLFQADPLEGEGSPVYLFARASKTHERGSPRRGTLRYSNGRWWPNVDGANLLS